MSRRLATFRSLIPYRRFGKTSRATFSHPRYFSLSQRLRGVDHHAILGVSKDATRAEIQQAYRRESLKKHPDVNKSPNAKTEFQALLKAEEALEDSLLAREDAGRTAAEELRKQQEERLEREERKIAMQLEKQRQQQETEKAEKLRKQLEKTKSLLINS